MPRQRKKTAAELTYTRADRKGGRQINAIDEGKIVGHLVTRPGGGGEELDLGFVSPSHQRRGVATTMLNLARHELGYTPVNDTALTPKAEKWTSSVGVPPNPKGSQGYRWAPGQEEDSAIGIQEKQSHMLQAQQFDPETVRQRAYYKPKKSRKKPEQYEQGTLGI